SRYRADIERELTGSSTTGATAFSRVGRYEHVRQTLDLNLEIGLFRDFAAYAYLPIVLSDAQSIGGSSAANPWSSVVDVPVKSPTRSALDVITTGFMWAPLNQSRTPEVPTWVLLFDTTTPIGKLLNACNAANLSQPSCNNSPGLTRGTQGVH